MANITNIDMGQVCPKPSTDLDHLHKEHEVWLFGQVCHQENSVQVVVGAVFQHHPALHATLHFTSGSHCTQSCTAGKGGLFLLMFYSKSMSSLALSSLQLRRKWVRSKIPSQFRPRMVSRLKDFKRPDKEHFLDSDMPHFHSQGWHQSREAFVFFQSSLWGKKNPNS